MQMNLVTENTSKSGRTWLPDQSVVYSEQEFTQRFRLFKEWSASNFSKESFWVMLQHKNCFLLLFLQVLRNTRYTAAATVCWDFVLTTGSVCVESVERFCGIQPHMLCYRKQDKSHATCCLCTCVPGWNPALTLCTSPMYDAFLYTINTPWR